MLWEQSQGVKLWRYAVSGPGWQGVSVIEATSQVSPSSVNKTFLSSGGKNYKCFVKGKSKKICGKRLLHVLRAFCFWVSLGNSERWVGWCITLSPLRRRHQGGMKSTRVLWGQMFVRENGKEAGEAGRVVRSWFKSDSEWRREGSMVGEKRSWPCCSLRKVRQGHQSPWAKEANQKSPTSPRTGSALLSTSLLYSGTG